MSSRFTRDFCALYHFKVSRPPSARCVQSAAAATKAQFDKYVVDQVEEKAAFDKLMHDTAAQAAQHKAVADKAMMDMGELQVGPEPVGVEPDLLVGPEPVGIEPDLLLHSKRDVVTSRVRSLGNP